MIIIEKNPDGKSFYGCSMSESSNSFQSSCGGGGSGYFGGGCGAATGGGGGSGFIDSSFIDLNNKIKKVMIDGNSKFPGINGETMIGNPSNGMIKVTLIDFSFSYCFHTKSFHPKLRSLVLICIIKH